MEVITRKFMELTKLMGGRYGSGHIVRMAAADSGKIIIKMMI